MILLDTHVVIWLASNSQRLSKQAMSAVEDERDNHGGLAISAVTMYEIAQLSAKRRIDLRTSPELFLDAVESHFIVMPLTGRICAETIKLPSSYPNDPMDRLIGATAITEGLKLITADAAIRKSKAVSVVW